MFYISGLKTLGVARETRAGHFLNGFKNIPQNVCPSGVQTKVRNVREDITMQEKQGGPHYYSLCALRLSMF